MDRYSVRFVITVSYCVCQDTGGTTTTAQSTTDNGSMYDVHYVDDDDNNGANMPTLRDSSDATAAPTPTRWRWHHQCC